ncbi:hypothetical protein ACQY0O_001127 [Thecaphora frezii]
MNVREARTVVIITGSHTITAGYGIHEILRRPTVSLVARVGLPRSSVSSASSSTSPPDYHQYLVGAALDEAERKGQDLAIFWPMRRGTIRDWQQMIALWRHVLFSLLPVKRSANDSHILVGLPAPVSRSTYHHVAQVFFQHFNAPALCIVEKPLLAAYGVGTMNATVVDLGWEACDVTPVLDCHVYTNANTKTNVGARHCTLYLAHLLARDQSLVKALEALLRYRRSKNGGAAVKPEREEAELHEALVALARQLVEDGHVVDDEAVRSGGGGLSSSGAHGDGAETDEGNFDIAAALVEERNRKAMEEEEERRRAALEAAQAAGEGDEEAMDEAAIASITGEEGQAGGSADEKAVVVVFRGLRLKVGTERFRFLEPLFRPEVLEGVRGIEEGVGDEPFGSAPVADASGRIATEYDVLSGWASLGGGGDGVGGVDWSEQRSLPETIAQSINSVDELDRQVALWENLIVTGSPARVKTIQMETIDALGRFVAASHVELQQMGGPGGEPNPWQPRNVRALKVPDYFSEFKERNDLAGFVGGLVYAKLVFGDAQAKGYITKQAYNDQGPGAAFSVRPVA